MGHKGPCKIFLIFFLIMPRINSHSSGPNESTGTKIFDPLGGIPCFRHLACVRQHIVSINHNSEVLNHVSKTEKQGKIRPIISQIGKPKLSAYFRLARTSQFLTRDWVNLNYRYHTVHVRWLPDPYEMPKIWNLSYP